MIVRKKNKIDKTNKTLWYCLETDFENLTGTEFEEYVAKLYRKMGYRVTMTKTVGDDGVDFFAKKRRITIAVQVKNWRGKVTNTDVLKTSGARQMFHTNYAMIITSSTFTPAAWKTIKRSPRIRGMDGLRLKRLFRQYYVIKKPKQETVSSRIKGGIKSIFGRKTPKTTSRKTIFTRNTRKFIRKNTRHQYA